MEILKTFFDRRSDGIWQIARIKSISLKPDGDTSGDFYPVANDLVVVQPNIAGTVSSILGQSIAPVVANVPGEATLRCLGTGFLISCTGLFITAAHVITDPIDRSYGNVSEIDDLTWHVKQLNLGVMIPNNPLSQVRGYLFCSIEWAEFLAEHRDSPIPFKNVDLKLSSDIAICKVASIAENVGHQPLSIVQSGLVGTGMAVGKLATAVGYAGMQDVTLRSVGGGVTSGDFSFRLHVSRGRIDERYPDNFQKKSVPSPGPCFSTRAKYPAGMSGSPIFDDERIYVHGVVSKGWEDENGPIDYGFGSMLAPSLHLPIKAERGKTLLDLLASSQHGMAKLSVPGA